MLLVKAIESFKNNMINMERSKETIKSYSIELRLFSGYLAERYNGPVYLEEILFQDIDEYLQAFRNKKHSSAAKNHTIYILRSFYKFSMKKGYIINNICTNLDRIPEARKERIFLIAEEVRELIPKIPSPIACLIINVLYHTGMRISECLNLTLGDVDLKNNVITVRNTKNKKDRQIPIHKNIESLMSVYLAEWRRRKGSPYFFTTDRTDRVSPDYINRILRETTLGLGWDKKVTCHTLRHSFASSLAARNVNIVNIQKLLGHTDLSTTSVYTHTNMTELKNAISAI